MGQRARRARDVLRALLGYQKLPIYRVVDRASGETLAEVNDYQWRRPVETLIDKGRTWETLDVIDTKGESRLHGHLPDYGSLAIAQTMANSMVLAETYEAATPLFTCPAALITCSEKVLDDLMQEVDAVCWGSDREISPMLSFMPLELGEQWGVEGGFVEGRLWVSDVIERFGWAAAVWEVLTGERDHLPRPKDGKSLQVLSLVPPRIRDETRDRLRLIVEASTISECEARRAGLAAWLRRRGQEEAAERLSLVTDMW